MEETLRSLTSLPNLQITEHVPLALHTRFGIGGPADALIESASAASFIAALQQVRASQVPFVVIGSGSNLIVADEGFRGIVLKFSGSGICIEGTRAIAEAGAVLQTLVDATVSAGLSGIHTMTGIPGWVGAAVYGNAGAYGHSISEFVHTVRFFDGTEVRAFNNAQCQFQYRESIFKKQKDWIVLSVELNLQPADAAQLKSQADAILNIRNEKYPPTMKCAGSIFKNYLLAELPPAVAASLPKNVIREGKVPSAYFLEQVGAKGMQVGDIHVAEYHANLIYNASHGTARDLIAVIQDLKQRIESRFGIPLEEEVQYVGRV